MIDYFDGQINVNSAGTSRDKTMDDKLLYILNDDKQNYPCCNRKVNTSRISRHKAMAVKLMLTQNDDKQIYPFCRINDW